MADDHDELVDRIVEAVATKAPPVLVAIDGRSGAGKSTLAAAVAAAMSAGVIDGDDFYAGGTAELWDTMTPAEKVAHCIDWRRQRPVLSALARGRTASWEPYDWDADDGRLAEPVALRPHDVVILEGAYSARPELADLLDLTVLLEVPSHVRQERLRRREGEHYRVDWEARWASAEDDYFGTVMPPESFDVVLGLPWRRATPRT